MTRPFPRRPTNVVQRVVLATALGLLLVLVSPPPAAGQDQAPLYLSVMPETGELRIRIGDLFDEPGLTRALHSGLPVRIRVM